MATLRPSFISQKTIKGLLSIFSKYLGQIESLFWLKLKMLISFNLKDQMKKEIHFLKDCKKPVVLKLFLGFIQL